MLETVMLRLRSEYAKLLVSAQKQLYYFCYPFTLFLLCEYVWSVNLFIARIGFHSTCQLGHGAVRGSARVSWGQVTLHRIRVTEEIPKGNFASCSSHHGSVAYLSHLVTCLLSSAEGVIISKPFRIPQQYIKASCNTFPVTGHGGP
jgi:hypothetical protein